MFDELRKELHYATRGLLRDTYLCHRLVERLRANEQRSAADMAAIQRELLARTLRAAARRLPFYRRPLRSVRTLRPNDAVDFLTERMPIITKEDLLARRDSLYPAAGGAKPWTIVGRTSGTTGTPLEIVRSVQSVLWAHAFKKRHWTWCGFTEGMPRASLRGDMVAAPEQTMPPFWVHNRFNNQLLISARHLRAPFLPYIADALERFAPFLLEAYPSTAYEVALYLQQMGRVINVPFVYTGSEPLYPHQRTAIEVSFGAKVMDHYGMAERVAYATECEYGALHVNSDYSYFEIVDDKGRPTDDYGYVVGTTFHNLAMPLIRYRLSDRTRWRKQPCPCRRVYPAIEPVSGKYEDLLWGSDGAPVSPSVVTFAFKELKNVQRSQIAQLAPGKWAIRVVPTEKFSSADSEKLIHNIRRLVDPGLQLNVVVLDDIPRTSAGKYKWVVNEWRDGKRDRAQSYGT